MQRIFPPSRYDKAEYKTICTVHEEQGVKFYIQVSKDSDSPLWLTIGDFFEITLQHLINDPSFMHECFKRFEAKNEL